ncbi:MAG: transcriptional regulator [Acidobacteriota bacterium]
MQAVWSDTFVTDEVLTNAVWKLRQALGDDSRHPQFIRNIPRRGYQLIAAVTFEEKLEETAVHLFPGQRRRYWPDLEDVP